VARRDVDSQRLYRFRLTGPDGSTLDCVVDRGRLTALTPSQATLEPRELDPSPGVAASAACGAVGARSATPLAIELLDSYAPGGLPGRMRQRVEVDGTPVLDHDLASEPGSGWLAAPLGVVPAGARRQTSIRIVAVRPERGAAWGKAASTTFQLARSRETP
jgi:hypothetical protein